MALAKGSGRTSCRTRPAPSCCAGRFSRRRCQPDPHRTMSAVKNILPPMDILAIPTDGLQKSGLERLGWMPPKLLLDLTGIDGIAAIVAGSVGYIFDQPPPASRSRGLGLVESIADRTNDIL